MRVLLNGINVISSGGRAVVYGMVSSLETAADITFDLVVPQGYGYEHLQSSKNLNIHLMPCRNNRYLRRLTDVYINVAGWCREFQSDICFTLGDIGPIRLPLPHVVLLQQAMLVYRDTSFEKLWTLYEKCDFKYKRWHFAKMAENCAAITVQTPVMAKRLHEVYHVPQKDIWVIPSALPLHSSVKNDLTQRFVPMMIVNKPHRLLFLAAGYEHKNHIILPLVAEELRRRGLDDVVQIFVTLDPDKSSYEHKIIKQLEGYKNCITNLNRLDTAQVSKCYVAASALLLPTMVESFGLVYLEAMRHGCPILTSDRDFSRWMCGDLAYYFDPLDPISIADVLERFVKEGKDKEYKKIASQRLKEFPSSWKTVARQYADMLRQVYAAQA
jgi:glycosyltransferase involved in cell wall biosynthesis